MEDIIEEMQKATEEVPEASEVDNLQDDNIDLPSDDFEETDAVEDQDPVESSDRPLNFKRMARGWVKVFNVFQKTSLSAIYKKTILQKGDLERVKEYQKEADLNKNTIEDVYHTHEESYYVVKRFEKYIKSVEELPFTEEEINDLTDPLAEVIKKYSYLQTGPEAQLLLSVIIIMIPRLEHAFPLFAKKLKDESE